MTPTALYLPLESSYGSNPSFDTVSLALGLTGAGSAPRVAGLRPWEGHRTLRLHSHSAAGMSVRSIQSGPALAPDLRSPSGRVSGM